MLKLKYPCKISGKMYPKGYEVEQIKNLKFLKIVIPEIDFKKGSKNVAVHFPDMPKNSFTILHIDQVEIC